MTRAAYFNCFSGIAGDMALGALIDAGAETQYVIEVLSELGVDGWSIDPKKVNKSSLFATYANVRANDDNSERAWRDICTLIESAPLPSRVSQRALQVFTALATAEATIHDVAVDEVHFHEVGGVDAIVDIVGTCAALESLGVDEVFCSAVSVGTGTITAAHGTFPNPAPATVALLKSAVITGTNHPFELTTPTGAAIVSGLSTRFGAMPSINNPTVGYGAGTRDIEGTPNVVQVIVGDMAEPSTEFVMLESNVDDVTGEVLAYTIERLLDAGANDAWITPIVMKKGRPAFMVSVLCEVAQSHDLCQLLRRETGTLGIRIVGVTRQADDRRFASVNIDGSPVRIKVGPHRAKAEFADAAAVAAATGIPLRQVIERAERIWAAQTPPD